jgi:hypothetical protein
VRKRKKGTKNKKRIKALLVLFVLILFALLIVIQLQKQNISKNPPDQCFKFSNISAFIQEKHDKTILIKTLYFEMTPLLDIHHLTIFAQGMANPTDYYWLEIANGTVVNVEIEFQFSVLSIKQEQGFPVTLRIYSDETEGYITLFIEESNIIG